MIHIARILAFCIATIASFTASECKFIEKLSYEDLPSVVGPAPALLIFTVDWCDHCREIGSEVRVLAGAATSANMSVAHIDADAEPAIAQKFGVAGYPSILFVKKGFSLKGGDVATEFHDYRWAEVIAEFVNNQTQADSLVIQPRSKYLEFRKAFPFNKGIQQRRPADSASNPGEEARSMEAVRKNETEDLLGLAHPKVLTPQNFREVLLNDPHMSVLALFYSPNDQFHKDTMIEWRQASSAIPEGSNDVNISIAMMNVGVDYPKNAEIARSLANVSKTPAAVAFARCPLHDDGVGCKRAEHCEEGACDSLTGLFDFLTNVIAKRLDIDHNQEQYLASTVETHAGATLHSDKTEAELLDSDKKFSVLRDEL